MSELLVIGAGPGGVAAALTGARLGARVTLVERAALGGTCVHGGCIPAAAFHRTAELLDEIGRAAPAGVRASLDGVDWPRAQAWAGSVVAKAAGLTRASLDAAGVEVLVAAARFTGPGRVEAGGRAFAGVPVVIATGARAAPSPPGVAGSEEAMAFQRVPERLHVLAAARFGVEWADLFAHLGSRVGVEVAGDRLLPDEDADIAGFLQLLLERRGIAFGARPAPDAGKQVVLLEADRRLPVTADLGLETAGVATGPGGEVTVDAGCRTSAAGVWAAGDVAGPPWLSNRARGMGVVAATDALGGKARFRPERVPRSVNTHPALAAVGLTEEQAAARGIACTTAFGELATSLRGITLGEDQGALKLVVEPEFGELLGAHMVGPGAVEVIAQLAAAIELEAGYRELGRVLHLHPSLAELVTDAIATL